MSLSTSGERGDSTSGPIVLHSEDVDEAIAGVSSVFHPHELSRFASGAHFRADLNAVVAADMVCGKIRYSNVTRLYCPYISGIHVNLPLSGRFLSASGGQQTPVEYGTAVVYDTGSDASLTLTDTQPNVFAVKFEPSVVHDTLEELLGRPVAQPIRLGGAVNITSPEGRAWRTVLLATYRSQVDGSFWTNPRLAEPMRYLVVAGLLNLTRHQYSDDLSNPPATVARAPIRRAADFITVNPMAALTPVSIAREVGLSVRALQRGFRKYLDTTPTEYVRSVRMKGAHDALAQADPASHTVAGIASRWGFTHYGRFASEYRQRYGVSPSQTLQLSAASATHRRHS